MQAISHAHVAARPAAKLSSRTAQAVPSLPAPVKAAAGAFSCSSDRSLRLRCSASQETSRRAVLALPGVLIASRALEATAAGSINPEPLGDGYARYYGKATAVSSYAGYGGNDNNNNQFRYYFDIPDSGWSEGKVNKVDKSTNGTDVRFLKGNSKGSKIYLTSLMGYPKLKDDRKSIISDLALSDYDLQDAVDAADVFEFTEREKNGQTYVDYVIDSPGVQYLITVTTDGSRIYALFGQGADKSDLAAFRRARDSFTTLNVNL